MRSRELVIACCFLATAFAIGYLGAVMRHLPEHYRHGAMIVAVLLLALYLGYHITRA